MKQVTNLQEVAPEPVEREFTLNLADGTSSRIKLVKDAGEWVLQGDDRQRFCQSELESILDKIKALNMRITNERY